MSEKNEQTFENSRKPERISSNISSSALPKRFYSKVAVESSIDGHAITLDGRFVKTPSGQLLSLPQRDLATAVAEEWSTQIDVIDPAAMPLTRIVNAGLDGVAADPGLVREDIVRYGGSDLTCYRASEPLALVRAQEGHWDPILAWAAAKLGARFQPVTGIMFEAQPAEAIVAFRSFVEATPAPLPLTSMHVMTTLTGSALIAAALACGHLSLPEAWAAAHVDEDHQILLWGEDGEALARRAQRFKEMAAAARLYRLAMP